MFLDIICTLIVIGHIYHIIMKTIWNFNNGFSLNYNTKNISEITRNFIFVLAITHLPSIIQIIMITVLFISGLGMYKYIAVKNKTINQNNPDLQSLYISEIKKDTRNTCISAIIIYTIIIIVFIYL